MSCIDDISEVDVGRTVTLTYTAPHEGFQVLFVVCGGKAPPGTSGIAEFGNNDPAEISDYTKAKKIFNSNVHAVRLHRIIEALQTTRDQLHRFMHCRDISLL